MNGKTNWGLVVALAVAVAVIVFLVTPKMDKSDSDPMPKAAMPRAEDLAVTVSSAVSSGDDYQLVVGANPSISTKALLPPTNSVVITGGETELQALREQAKKARQQTQQ